MFKRFFQFHDKQPRYVRLLIVLMLVAPIQALGIVATFDKNINHILILIPFIFFSCFLIMARILTFRGNHK